MFRFDQENTTLHKISFNVAIETACLKDVLITLVNLCLDIKYTKTVIALYVRNDVLLHIYKGLISIRDCLFFPSYYEYIILPLLSVLCLFPFSCSLVLGNLFLFIFLYEFESDDSKKCIGKYIPVGS